MKNQKPTAQIELNIEELSLSGFNQINRFQLATAVQLELTNLLSKSNLSTNELSNDRNSFAPDSISIAAEVKSESLGIQIAQSIHQSISSQQSSRKTAITAIPDKALEGQQTFSFPNSMRVASE